jgi:hypothetical protein
MLFTLSALLVLLALAAPFALRLRAATARRDR